MHHFVFALFEQSDRRELDVLHIRPRLFQDDGDDNGTVVYGFCAPSDKFAVNWHQAVAFQQQPSRRHIADNARRSRRKSNDRAILGDDHLWNLLFFRQLGMFQQVP